MSRRSSSTVALQNSIPFPDTEPHVSKAFPGSSKSMSWSKYAKFKGPGGIVPMWKKSGGQEERLRQVIADKPDYNTMSKKQLEIIWRRFANATLLAVQDVINAPYFVGLIDAGQARDALADKPEGAFLVRFSSDIGSYALSAQHSGQTGHWRISRTPSGGLKIDDSNYDNLEHLVEFHRRIPLRHSDNPRGVLLKLPMPSIDAVACPMCNQYVPHATLVVHTSKCTSAEPAAPTTYGSVRDVANMRKSQDAARAKAEEVEARERASRSSSGAAAAGAGGSGSSGGGGGATYDTMPRGGGGGGGAGGRSSGSAYSAAAAAAAGAPGDAYAPFAAEATAVTLTLMVLVNRESNGSKLSVPCGSLLELKNGILRGRELPIGADEADFLYEDPHFAGDWCKFPTDFSELATLKSFKVKVLTSSNAARDAYEMKVIAAAKEAGGGRLDIQELTFGEELGKGAFGVVVAGKFRGFDVAIKTYPAGSEDAAEEFRKECEILVNIPKHPNLVSFFGYTDRTDPRHGLQHFIVLERVWAGSLDEFMKDRQLSNEHLVHIITDIARGMEALHKANIIHRDLALRNVLMTGDMRAKVTDFGLSRFLDTGEYAMREETKLPLKQMAPEALATGRFTRANDTWAFGVVVWVVFSGHDPYAFLGRQQVAIAVRDQQLELSALPPTTPNTVRAIVKGCQQFDPQERPTFTMICKLLDDIKEEEL